jgi:acyl-CoA oxidase
VVHSPTITSTKYWPGDQGLNADHAIVYARLKIGPKDYGVHPFLVQTRDSNTHLPLPGIEGGDIGPKYGYNSKENGFLRFTNVRIPRRNMVLFSSNQ